MTACGGVFLLHRRSRCQLTPPSPLTAPPPSPPGSGAVDLPPTALPGLGRLDRAAAVPGQLEDGMRLHRRAQPLADSKPRRPRHPRWRRRRRRARPAPVLILFPHHCSTLSLSLSLQLHLLSLAQLNSLSLSLFLCSSTFS
uniref:Uncharacterized protein n=1 Tax=Oryza glaberrima TaxID=4538 RepID=I1Q9Y8_ORYGL